MSHEQILVFTVFVLFYVPCVATIAVLWKEFGWKKMTVISLATLMIALVIAMAVRGFLVVV
jgi:ferrous iron transport protein B